DRGIVGRGTSRREVRPGVVVDSRSARDAGRGERDVSAEVDRGRGGCDRSDLDRRVDGEGKDSADDVPAERVRDRNGDGGGSRSSGAAFKDREIGGRTSGGKVLPRVAVRAHAPTRSGREIGLPP